MQKMKLIITFIKVIGVALLVIVATELSLRIVGFNPYGQVHKERSVETKPSKLFVTDSILGYTCQQGAFEVILNRKLAYKVRIEQDGSRYNPYNSANCAKKMNVYGCSFFAGMGVDDEEVLSAQLNKANTGLCIANYSIPGHGLTAQFLQFKRHVQNSRKPDCAVFSIADFHLPRNVGAFSYLRSFGNIHDAPVLYPVARLSQSGALSFSRVPVVPGSEAIARKSALYTEIIDIIDKQKWTEPYQYKVYRALCDSIATYAEQNSIQYLFHVITTDNNTKQMITHLKSHKYPHIVSKVDYKNSKLNLMPADGHPNAYAHQQYAKEISEYYMGLN